MPKHKISKKELQQPDQFVDFWSRVTMGAARWASEHQRALVVSFTALLTVVIGSIVLSQVSQRRSSHAAEALDRGERIAAAEPAVAGATMPDDGVPHLASAREQAEAALKDLDEKFGSGRGPLSAEGTLVRARLLLDLGRAPEAASAFQSLLDGKLDARVHFLAREGLGYAYEAQGKLAEAAAAFSQLGDDASRAGLQGFYKDRALYHQARLAELRSNPADAARLYHEVLEKFPTTSLRDEIQNRIAALELK